MAGLEDALKKSQSKRLRMIATDGVFSMDGFIAKLPEIVALARKYDAMVMVDESHATGFMGPTGRGTPEHHGVMKEIDVITSTLGKALGGASGGFTTGRREIVDLLRQRSRPYLFSNSVAPSIAGASIAAFELISSEPALRERLMANTRTFREGMTKAGFTIKPGETPIVPIMLGDAKLAQQMAAKMLAEGIYVIGFSFPVVPRGEARIRVQLSAAHEPAHVERAVQAFIKVGRELGVVR
jgi:glycine C-acetyltransferase